MENNIFESSVKYFLLPVVNYAMTIKGETPLRYVDITNDTAVDWYEITLNISGDMLTPYKRVIDTIPAGQTVNISDINITPDTTALRELTENVETTLTISLSMGSQQVYEKQEKLKIQTMDEWPGESVPPALLACYITPNAQAINSILVRAAAHLQNYVGDGAFDAYMSNNPNRIRAQVAAIYNSLQEHQIEYCVAPPSFEKTGQKVRLADKVVGGKLANCLDISLLFAACLEAVGLHPIVIVYPDHAMVGCWLMDKYYPQLICDDPSLLPKLISDGINEMVIVEGTAVTSAKGIPFEDAVKMAIKTHAEKEMQYFVDVYRCRMDGYTPLPTKIDGQWQVSGNAHQVGGGELKDLTIIDVKTDENRNITRQQIWERKLLDFSLRNNLINVRLGRKTIPFVTFNIEGIEDILQDGKDIEITALQSDTKIKPNEFGIYESATSAIQYEKAVVEELKSHRMTSYLDSDTLKSVTKTLFRDSRTAIEENGANTLFLVLGMMKWYESDRSERPRYAPLLLLPVSIVRKSGNNYVIRMRDEDITFNTTLTEMLRQNFEINLTGLNPLPLDEHGVDVRKILATVRAHLFNHPRWDVLEEAVLGLFSFNKFVMWNDIHNNADKLKENPIIDSLIERRRAENIDTRSADARVADRQVEPKIYAIPVDVDSSQMEAVIESGEGKSFILYGPPGTGKSQTITNMISNALYHNKRILFVAQKMAALEVVQKRLTKIGLGAFCLEMHSNKMTKSHLLGQLRDALEITRIKEPAEYASESAKLYQQRQSLIGYIESLHRMTQFGLSLHECINGWQAIEGEMIKPDMNFLTSNNKDSMLQHAETLRQLDTVFQITGSPSSHPLRGLNITDGSMGMQGQIQNELQALAPLIGSALGVIQKINSRAGRAVATSMSGLKWVSGLLAYRQTVISKYGDAALNVDPAALSAEWNEVNSKWFIPKFFAKKSFLNKVKVYGGVGEQTLPTMLTDISNYRNTAAAIGLTDTSSLTPQEISDTMRLNDSLTAMANHCVIETDNLADVASLIPQWCANISMARDWSQWCTRMNSLRQANMQSAINFVMQGHSGDEAAKAMTKGVYHDLSYLIIDNDPYLKSFQGMLYEDLIRKYRDTAKQFQDLTKKELYCHLASKVPSITINPAFNSEMGILKRYIASNGRGASIRQIMDNIPTLLPKLCPCMLMSPLSVAQYIDLSQEKFDIVIFDEASQMPTSEAVGAIARGKALIVTGDPKQMPPTSFFQMSSTDESEADIDDMESILDDCITLSLPARYLTWHYRSRHESLITFSNSQYYDGKLFTFPSADDRNKKVRFVEVDGVYDYGKSRSNRAEAEAIVEEVINIFNDPARNRHSVGIVSFSKVQQDLIEDILTERLTGNTELERLAYDGEEPIFIKNLENVQGDERDIILFSIGYGPDKNGHVSMNFGPLNNTGGERRLNVAVSRARYEMVVFSTLQPEQIDLRRSSAKGVEGLKRFLEFAKYGKMAVDSTQMAKGGETTHVIKAVTDMLNNNGYQTDLKVGRSEFKIDIAVIDPEDDGHYILGIQCDGNNYHDTKTERDREICQPGVLAGLGWSLFRLWSVDWFLNPQGVTDRLLKTLATIKMAREQQKKAPTQPTENKPKTNSPLPFAVSEDEIIDTSKNEMVRDYKTADIRPLRSNNTAQTMTNARNSKIVLNHIMQILQVEQPVTFSYMCNRIAEIWNITQKTANFRQVVAQALAQTAYRDPRSPMENAIYWANQQASMTFTGYRESNGRVITDIPIIELMNVMRYAIQQQVRVPKDGLMRQVSKLMGFQKITPKIEEILNEALRRLIIDGGIVEENNEVRIVS